MHAGGGGGDGDGDGDGGGGGGEMKMKSGQLTFMGTASAVQGITWRA